MLRSPCGLHFRIYVSETNYVAWKFDKVKLQNWAISIGGCRGWGLAAVVHAERGSVAFLHHTHIFLGIPQRYHPGPNYLGSISDHCFLLELSGETGQYFC